MNKNVIIFIPDDLEYHKVGYISGHKIIFPDIVAYYVFTGKILEVCPTHCVGYITGSSKKINDNSGLDLLINNENKSTTISGNCGMSYKTMGITEVVYNYNSFKNSYPHSKTEHFGKHFVSLVEYIEKDRQSAVKLKQKSFLDSILLSFITILVILLKLLENARLIFSHSSTFLHFKESCMTVKFFLEGLHNDKKLTPKLGNILVSRLIDLIMGIVVVDWFLLNESEILEFIQKSTEELITNLKNLLVYLMGSPIGLKLNYSFNKSLGQFFFCHISLWRIFLQGLQPLLVGYFKVLVLPGALGLSFQIAMISDVISVATFHVYCIYVYAARLFNLQLRGLTSLWRLFIGRKYNPLRQRVDSCQYSQNQLFIGTMGFTILLFLLPTTTMYYTVFYVLRLTTLCISNLLQRMRHHLNTLPVYILILWIFNCPSLSGKLILNHKGYDENGTLKIEAKLTKFSLASSIQKFIPDTELGKVRTEECLDHARYFFHFSGFFLSFGTYKRKYTC
ncbi:unnamed protein product [Phaedon cochleariae]|uniref:Phosphatidylinositol N-acetylglucosaminyltransferase subunit Q n=1 Tax=Phaedon cochleariae TaxID=80249 RepID=A0A9P0GU03_PHACE|nr:unnamed protein product [Phaedon cochleariae]